MDIRPRCKIRFVLAQLLLVSYWMEASQATEGYRFTLGSGHCTVLRCSFQATTAGGIRCSLAINAFTINLKQ